ncbi:MAG TPA: sigma-70 family RNA polymerase sigma factor [Myxococcales bacterium]|nr:sigma-70 family RNA polymerase sigma factor [Myxococcales bacterium]
MPPPSAHFQRAREARPGIDVPEEEFQRYLSERLPDPGADPGELNVEDLYVACGCALGNPQALAALERELTAVVPAAVSGIRLDASAVQEVVQLVRQKILLGGEDGHPRILDYAGRAPLKSWLRAMAVRMALNFKRDERVHAHEDEDLLANLPDPDEDPELRHVRDRYRQEFKDAFRAAFETLAPEERNMLRLHFVEGVPLDKIGKLYDAHKSTVSRWMARARETLLKEMRQVLAERLNMANPDVDSLIRLAVRHFELSLFTVLRRS